MIKLLNIKWEECEELCNRLYDGNPFISPYQEYCFLNRIRKSTNIHRIKDWIEGKNENYLVEKEGNVICIIPLVINKKRKEINILGYLCSVGHLDFIYGKDITLYDFKEIFNLLSEKYKGYILHLDRISQYSKMFSYLESINARPVEKSICAKIDLTNYDEWYGNLSKRCRQNLRTAYNRINREEKKMEVNVKIADFPTDKMKKDNLRLLAKRTIEHNKMSAIFYPLMKMLKSKEAFTNALFETMRFIGANIYLDGKTIAICNGVIANDGRAIITRLSVDTEYGVYCPGGLILNELIKAVLESPHHITSIDLSRGDEKYKYSYGGEEHYNYEYKLFL